MKKLFIISLLATCLFTTPVYVLAQYEDDTGASVAASPKKPWGDFAMSEEAQKSRPWWSTALLWFPNRVLDFIDIFRVDVGVGPAYGAVARVSKYGQIGYRDMAPMSIRVGDFGRKVPAMVERSSELGAGPGFLESKDRTVCPGEVGLGADLFIAGAYGGVCFDEVIDFLGGIFFLDINGDDLKG